MEATILLIFKVTYQRQLSPQDHPTVSYVDMDPNNSTGVKPLNYGISCLMKIKMSSNWKIQKQNQSIHREASIINIISI